MKTHELKNAIASLELIKYEQQPVLDLYVDSSIGSLRIDGNKEGLLILAHTIMEAVEDKESNFLSENDVTMEGKDIYSIQITSKEFVMPVIEPTKITIKELIPIVLVLAGFALILTILTIGLKGIFFLIGDLIAPLFSK